jgi:hypothetical protein
MWSFRTYDMGMMNTQTIVTMLAQHSIRTRVVRGQVQGEDVFTVVRAGVVRTGRRWQTVTGMTRAQLLAWLGY